MPMATFSPSGAEADWRAEDVSLEPGGSGFTVVTPQGDRIPARVPLTGSFNVANALCAIALAGEAGLDPRQVADGIAHGGGVPGRLEQVDAGQDFLAIVDYAHKPDAMEAALAALRPLTEGRLVLVIGAGGDRDTGKRPVMGEIGARLADVLVVTDDNPRTEDPAAIRAAVLAGAAKVDDAGRGPRDRRPAYGDPAGRRDGARRRHGRDRRQGTRDRPGDRRNGASLRRPRRAPRRADRASCYLVIAMTLEEVAGIVGGRLVDAAPTDLVRGPAFLDSRNPEQDGLFVAFAGEHVDGHDYALAAVEGGAAAVLGTPSDRCPHRAGGRRPGCAAGARARRAPAAA